MQTNKPPAKAGWHRLKLVGAGLLFAGVGGALILHGVLAYKRAGQPLFSYGLVATGVLCMLLAMIPDSWVAKAAETPRRGAKRGG
jgi:hypothetical protein